MRTLAAFKITEERERERAERRREREIAVEEW